MMSLWLACRYLRAGRGVANLSTILSLIGIVIGVGSLVVAMAVVSGYQATLKRSVIDVTSHLVVSRSSGQESQEGFKKILQHVPHLQASTPFVFLEAILAHNGQLSGVSMEGVEESTVDHVLNLKSRLIEGRFHLSHPPATHPENGSGQESSREEVSEALIGKGLALKHQLKVGDQFRLVLPSNNEMNQGRVKPRVIHLRVSGILNMGRHDFDERYLLTDLKTAQRFAQIGHRITGYRLLLKDSQLAMTLSRELSDQFRPQYMFTTWYDVNQNLFRAIELEKPVIFFVLLVIVIAAAFNISNTLFVSVIKRFQDISILKAMGAKQSMLTSLFTYQGLAIGGIGALLGLGLGLLVCRLFLWAQNHWELLPAEVYKLDKIYLEFRFTDLVLIFLSTMLICWLATIKPALRGSRLPPVEGLRYE